MPNTMLVRDVTMAVFSFSLTADVYFLHTLSLISSMTRRGGLETFSALGLSALNRHPPA